MVTFRKSLLLLAVIAMMATAANAQIGVTPPFACVANAGVPPTVRSEGLAELVGDVVLTCTGGTPTQLGQTVPRINFRIFLNTNVTSRLVDGTWNESFIIIDEPTPADQTVCTERSGCPILGVGAEPGVDYSQTYNMFQGTHITGNTVSEGNTIEWLGVPIDPPGTQAARVIRITNVRANAAQKGVGGLLIPSQLIMYISATGTTSMPINNPQQIVAFVQDGLRFDAGDGSFLQCEDPKDDSDNPIGIEFQELFATAFKRRNHATSISSPSAIVNQNEMGPNSPKVEYNTETGFYNASLSSTNNADDAGLASQGTRLVAHFKGIPDGVSVYVTALSANQIKPGSGACPAAGDPWGNPDCHEDIATIVKSADSNGKGGTPETASAARTMSSGNADVPSGFWKVPIVGGAGTATWEVLRDDFTATGDVPFLVIIDYTPNSSAGIPALGTGAVAGSYGPLSTAATAISDNLQPRFVDRSEDIDFVTINSCATNLLWPYVTNQAGFDTGMVISNTSMDPFGTATQEGPCTINYYGNSSGATPPAADTTPTVGAGGFAVWTLSSGGGVKPYGKPIEGVINSAPGFEGYVIAQCQFQFAHGYAFISDLGAQKLSQGYIALIMDSPIWGCNECGLTRTGTKSEPLNQ
jgi:hypothetical protein